MPEPVVLTGSDLDPGSLAAIAREGAPVTIEEGARERMRATAAVVERAVASGRAIYGVTTGLGSRVTDAVPVRESAGYPLRTVRGRATAVGEPLPRELVRAAMAVRLEGLCAGGSGARPSLADGLAALLNAGVHPEIPRSGSIGASDLCLMAHVGLTLIGEGRAELDGEWMEAGGALARSGLGPIPLGPRDGLAICSSSAVAIGVAALALHDARACLDAVQVSAALAMEGFRASLSPLDPRVVAARPAPGQEWAASGLRGLLRDGDLSAGGRPRRLQDPLSFRCASQLHGALHTALDGLESALTPELSGAADNPLVIAPLAGPGDPEADGEGPGGEILPTGNFSSPALALALDAVAIGCAQVAHAIAERQSRLKETRLSALPANLVEVDPGHAASRSGVAPLSKTAAALALEIRHLAAQVAILQAVTADGVEDDATGALQGALRLREQLTRLRLLVALELLVAAQAVDVTRAAADGTGPLRLGAGTTVAHRAIRELVPPLREDRALGPEVERLCRALLASGALLDRVRTMEAVA